MMKKIKKACSFILCLALIMCSCVAITPTASAVDSGKILKINWDHIRTVGNQAGKNSSGKSSESCSCFALAYATTIMDGTPRQWWLYNQNQSKDQYNVNAHWDQSNSGFKSTIFPTTEQEMYERMKDAVEHGRPSVVLVRKTGGTPQHYITVVGYTGAGDKASDFLIIDPAGGATKGAPENMGGLNYTLKKRTQGNHHLGLYQFVFTDKSGIGTVGYPSDSPSTVNKPTIINSNANSLNSLQVGKTFSITGTVQSNAPITNVTAGIYTTSNGKIYEKSASPNSNSYNIHNLDNALLFNKLGAGTYKYIVRATNRAGTAELINKTFTVFKPTEPTISFSPSSLSVDVGTSKTVSINFKGDGIKSIGGTINGTSICGASFGSADWDKGTTSLIVTGKKAGNATITVNLNDDNGKIFYSKSFSVTVVRPAEPIEAYLFDADVYYNLYGDLQRAFKKDDTAALKNHWEKFGKNEGRKASLFFDPIWYLNNNADVKRTYAHRI